MKKIKSVFAFVLIACLGFVFVGCDPVVEKFVVSYTVGIEFFVGEDWSDEQITGTAIYSDDTEKDVTAEMTTDTSNYDKTTPGTYTIKFEYDDIKVSYNVKVVNVMTHPYSIVKRINPVFANSFAEKDGVVQFSATYYDETESDEYYLKQTLSYYQEGDVIKEHIVYSVVDDTEEVNLSIYEMLYVGTKELGVITEKECFDDSANATHYYEVSSQYGSFEAFESCLGTLAASLGVTKYLSSDQFLNIYTNTYPNLSISNLTKTDNTCTLNLTSGDYIAYDEEGKIREIFGVLVSYYSDIPSELTAE